MRIVRKFPHKVREIENCWIPLSDGCRLAARIWLPEGAESAPVPAIVEYIPYRKRDGTRERDEPIHHYFAGHGYAAVRIDLRGAGESDGHLLDEYHPKEHEDGLEAISWIASQPWCTGAVGMMGKSWGGFNALQIAFRQPPALKAIITACGSDDRYADDAHYMGGCLLNENLIWGSVLLTLNAQPPDPAVVGERWRRMWIDRLEKSVLFPEIWLRHQRRDGYWKYGSVCEDYGRIRCPVFVIGGWADGYTNAVPRLLAGLRCPRKGIVGPWAHVYPHQGVPRPAIGFLQEALRWWDKWLKGVETGVMEEPMYRVWMQDGVQPRSFYEERPGRWVAEAAWPSPRIETRRFVLNRGRLDTNSGVEERLEYRSPEIVGLESGRWCGFGIEGEMPTDQRPDDDKSLTFDSEPLGETVEILGAPVVTLAVSVDRPIAFVAVRLNDVAPNGASTRVSYGLLNLTHRTGDEFPTPIEPGTRFTVRVQMNDIAHTFAPRHRLRVAVSTSYWPLVWPSPEPHTLSVFTGASVLELPVRPAHPADEGLRRFEGPAAAPPPAQIDLHPGGVRRDIRRDTASGEIIYTTTVDVDEANGIALSKFKAIALETGHAVIERFRIREGEPLSARAEIIHRTLLRRGDWSVEIETSTRLSASIDAFHLEAELAAREGKHRIFSRYWKRDVPRDLV